MTISKIRFLESQGLVDPERTPSGYRKFYDHDVERLRWILRQQREHFLPLKVIRGRLAESNDASNGGSSDSSEAVLELRPEVPEGPAAVTASDRSAAVTAAVATDAVATDASSAVTAGRAAPAQERPSRERPSRDLPSRDLGSPQASPKTYTAEELAAEVGAPIQLVRDLVQYGLLRAESGSGPIPYYGDDAVMVAVVARRFAEHGVEPRHLRPWRNSADREAGLFEQVVMPLVRQRNPKAREEAVAALENLEELGSDLRAALVRQALRDIRL